MLESDSKSTGLAFLTDLFGQLFSDRARIGAARYCTHNGFVGLLLLAGAVALRLSEPPDPLGTVGFVLVVTSAIALIAAFVVPTTHPRLVPAMLAGHGLIVLLLTVGLALSCAAWALNTPRHTFRYLPGMIAVGTTYGATLWADFGPMRGRPRPWRLAGFLLGVVMELVVGFLLLKAVLRG